MGEVYVGEKELMRVVLVGLLSLIVSNMYRQGG